MCVMWSPQFFLSSNSIKSNLRHFYHTYHHHQYRLTRTSLLLLLLLRKKKHPHRNSSGTPMKSYANTLLD